LVAGVVETLRLTFTSSSPTRPLPPPIASIAPVPALALHQPWQSSFDAVQQLHALASAYPPQLYLQVSCLTVVETFLISIKQLE